ncbi:hypothetical protein [Streptomyces sp. NPDC059378]|uniref:hypothetical protein n=1 Tax=Streptomyces sp. NPDC059378 TaxID=3346815 RepID=UPI003685A3E4
MRRSQVQHYDRGAAIGPPVPAGPVTTERTVIALRPDAGIFDTARCSFDVLADCFRELAFL